MLRIHHINPVLRATGVIGVVAAMVTGVTFAALNSQATLTANSISSGSAELQVGTTAGNTGQTKPGFTIKNLVPGSGSDKKFFLRNTGDSPLTVTAHVPQLPGAPDGGDYGFTGFENLTFDITAVDVEGCDDNVVHTNMLALSNSQVPLPCNDLPDENGARRYDVHADIKPEAVTGGQAGVGNFNLVFTGNAASAPATPPADNNEDQ